MATQKNRFTALIDNNNRGLSHSKNHRNQRHNKFQKDNRQNKFQTFEKKQKERNIDLSEKSFPSLVKSVDYTEEEKQANPTNGMSYIEKIKYFKELNEKKDSLPKGWISLNKNTHYEPFQKINLDDNPYYDPYSAYAIIYQRYINREELNNILGDISPYWNMDEEYEYDTRYLEENEDDDESIYSDYSNEDEIYDNL